MEPAYLMVIFIYIMLFILLRIAYEKLWDLGAKDKKPNQDLLRK